jgi:hypothetical protein
MSKFDSIALGKSTGSIGNITTTRLKGQNVAKAKITSTTNVNSPGQVTSRGRMSNIVMAYQFLAIFLQFAVSLRKPTESVYNAFVRLFKSLILDYVVDSKPLAAALLAGIANVGGNFIVIDSLVLAGTNLTVTFNTGGLPFVANSYIQSIGWKTADGSSKVVNAIITEAQWNAGTLVVAASLADSDNQGAYIYNLASKKNSNLLFA